MSIENIKKKDKTRKNVTHHSNYVCILQLVHAVCVCVCVCVVIPFILDVRFVGVPAGVSQEEGLTEFIYLPTAVLAFIFLPRRIQPFISLVDRDVEFCVLTI